MFQSKVTLNYTGTLENLEILPCMQAHSLISSLSVALRIQWWTKKERDGVCFDGVYDLGRDINQLG